MADLEQYPLLRVCSLLNEVGAEYLVVGGRACILHGLIRTTQDVDILDTLIRSKQTYREKDQMDVAFLRSLKERK